MRIPWILVGGLLLVAAAASGEAGEIVAGRTTITLPDTTRYSVSARRILNLEILRSAAIAERDTAWLAKLYAPDFEGVAANGLRVDRQVLLDIFAIGDPEGSFAIDELSVREFGRSALVMGRLRGLSPTGDVLTESRYLHAFVWRAGRWWIVAATGSAVQSR